MENLTELSFLVRLLPGILCGVILGWNADRLLWPRGILCFAARVKRAIGRVKLDRRLPKEEKNHKEVPTP